MNVTHMKPAFSKSDSKYVKIHFLSVTSYLFD